MTNTRIEYARCSTDRQDLTAQREALIVDRRGIKTLFRV
jgi:DNA invertase Pin-like site-specific DNA recombinase